MTVDARYGSLTIEQQNIVTMVTDRIDRMEANLIRSIETNKRDTDDDIARVEGRLDRHIGEHKEDIGGLHTRINEVGNDTRRVSMSVWERVTWVSLTLAAGLIMYFVRG